MSGFNFSTPVHGKERDYTVRTVNFDSIHRIVVNLNEGDRVIHTREIPYAEHLTDEELMVQVKRHHEERVEALQEMLKISAKLENKPDVDSNHKLGIVFLNSGMGHEAAVEFQRALSLDPDNAPLLNHLGLSFLLVGDHDQAQSVLRKAVTLKPQYPDLHNNYGLACFQAQDYKSAAAEFDQALGIHPKYAEAHFNKALALVSQAGDKQSLPDEIKVQLRSHLAKAVEFNGYFNNDFFKVAQNHLSKGQYQEARQALIEAKTTVLSQSGAEVYHEFYLRLKYGDEGVDRQATEHYISRLEEILEKHPRYVDVHNDLGIAYLIQCRFLFNRAIKEFKAALAINENYPQAKKNLKLAENEGKGFLILLRAILYF